MSISTKLYNKVPPQKKQNIQSNVQRKWVTFTYSGTETREITKIIHDTRMKVPFRTLNTIQNILQPPLQTDKYNRSSMYQMECLDCPLQYIKLQFKFRQTGSTFSTR
jgi:hypothetical protein